MRLGRCHSAGAQRLALGPKGGAGGSVCSPRGGRRGALVDSCFRRSPPTNSGSSAQRKTTPRKGQKTKPAAKECRPALATLKLARPLQAEQAWRKQPVALPRAPHAVRALLARARARWLQFGQQTKCCEFCCCDDGRNGLVVSPPPPPRGRSSAALRRSSATPHRCGDWAATPRLLGRLCERTRWVSVRIWIANSGAACHNFAADS